MSWTEEFASVEGGVMALMDETSNAGATRQPRHTGVCRWSHASRDKTRPDRQPPHKLGDTP